MHLKVQLFCLLINGRVLYRAAVTKDEITRVDSAQTQARKNWQTNSRATQSRPENRGKGLMIFHTYTNLRNTNIPTHTTITQLREPLASQ